MLFNSLNLWIYSWYLMSDRSNQPHTISNNLQNVTCLPFSQPGETQKERGSDKLSWLQCAVRWQVKMGQTQHSEEKIHHGRLWGLHRLSWLNTTLERRRWREISFKCWSSNIIITVLLLENAFYLVTFFQPKTKLITLCNIQNLNYLIIPWLSCMSQRIITYFPANVLIMKTQLRSG